MPYKVLVSDTIHADGVQLLTDRPGFQVDVKTDLDPESLAATIPDYDALVIRSATKVTPQIIEAAKNLKVVVRAGAGLDNVSIGDATRRGIVVMNTPGKNSVATAEHTITLIMAVHRHIAQAVASLKSGAWDKKKFQGHEVAGRTIGVIGLGKVGGIVAKLASRGLKMKVLGYDPAQNPDAVAHTGAKFTPLDEIFKQADVITLHTPLNDSTRKLINAEAISTMKDGVIIINCARGGIVDEQALLDALESGKVAAAGLDVYESSPPGDSPLVMHPRVVATPHLGASTTEAQVQVAVAAAEQIIDYLESGVVRNAVNVPVIGASDVAKMSPYIDLAKRLGQFAGGVAPSDSEITEMTVEYRGEVAEWVVKPITNAALVGLMGCFSDDVNFVNAAYIMQTRGIKVLETLLKSEADYESSITIRTVYSNGTSRSVWGGLIRRRGYEPRIMAIDDFVTEAVPAGPMLITRNRDIPGMIAGISGTLSQRGINVAQMNLSRDTEGGTALSIINIDEPADKETLDSIRQIEGILSVKQVILDN